MCDMNIDDLICELLDEQSIQDDKRVVFTDKALELIHEIADKCKSIPIVKETQQEAEAYAAGLSAEQVYVNMLHKIVEAPTAIHMKVSARMLIPIIDKKLKAEKGYAEGKN